MFPKVPAKQKTTGFLQGLAITGTRDQGADFKARQKSTIHNCLKYKHLARERHSESFKEASKLSKSKSCRSNAFANFGLQRAIALDVCT